MEEMLALSLKTWDLQLTAISYFIPVYISVFTLDLWQIKDQLTTLQSHSRDKNHFFPELQFLLSLFQGVGGNAMFTECSCILNIFLLIFLTISYSEMMYISQSNKYSNMYKSADC